MKTISPQQDLRMVAANFAVRSVIEYPKFRHKWSRQIRTYNLNELIVSSDLKFDGLCDSSEMLRVGIGGTRSPCVETFCAVSEITTHLVNSNVSIVSGGVPGVDLSAHLAAISQSNGTTLAVMANPVELGMTGHEWSSEFIDDRIRSMGGFVSEFDTFEKFGSETFRERLLLRDRVITALSDVFVVFECSVDSATVDTARRALLQGKPVVSVESLRLTRRQGIDQLETELGVRKLSRRDFSAIEIAEEILSIAKHYHSSILA